MGAQAVFTPDVVPRRYVVRSSDGWDYAVIVISEDNSGRGCLMIESSYGNWTYDWSHAGTDIRNFLIKTSTDYLTSKLLSGRPSVSGVYDADNTLARIKTWIHDELVGTEARKELSLLKECNHLEDEIDYYHWGHLTQIPDFWELVRRRPEPQLAAFFAGLWPAIKDLWLQEIEFGTDANPR